MAQDFLVKVKDGFLDSIMRIKPSQWFLLFLAVIFLPLLFNAIVFLHDVQPDQVIDFLTGNLKIDGFPYDARKDLFNVWFVIFSFLGFLTLCLTIMSTKDFIQARYRLIILIVLISLSFLNAIALSAGNFIFSLSWTNIFFEGPLGPHFSDFMFELNIAVFPLSEFVVILIGYLLTSPSPKTIKRESI